MGWGEEHRPPNDGAGTTGEILDAHARLDALGVKRGPLAVRLVDLLDNPLLYQ